MRGSHTRNQTVATDWAKNTCPASTGPATRISTAVVANDSADSIWPAAVSEAKVPKCRRHGRRRGRGMRAGDDGAPLTRGRAGASRDGPRDTS
jgi:hypothetical protein